MTVGEALTLSREAHGRYRDHLPRRVSAGASTFVVAGDAEAAGQALVEACKFRAEAHVQDPSRADPAWSDEAATYQHVALLDFYVEQLTRETEAVREAVADVLAAVAQTREDAPVDLQSVIGISDTEPSTL